LNDWVDSKMKEIIEVVNAQDKEIRPTVFVGYVGKSGDQNYVTITSQIPNHATMLSALFGHSVIGGIGQTSMKSKLDEGVNHEIP